MKNYEISNSSSSPYAASTSNREGGAQSTEHIKRSNLEKKLKDLERSYQERARKIKEAGENRLEELKKTGDERTLEKSKEQEARIKNLSDSANKIQERMEQERINLMDQHQGQIDDLKYNFSEKHQKIEKANSEQLMDKQQKGAESLAGQKLLQDAEMKSLIQKQQEESRDISDDNRFRNKLQMSNFEQSRLMNESKYQAIFNKQRFENETKLKEEESKHLKKMKELEDRHLKEYQQNVSAFKKTIDQANQDFKTKYQGILNNHQKAMNFINTSSQNNIKKMKEKLDKVKNTLEEKADDPFYSSINFNPKISNDDKNYYLSLPLPSYEQDSIQISGKGKNIRLTFNRNFQNEVEKDNGITQKYSKIEGFSKVIPVQDGIDDRKISKVYNDGVVTFVIPKL